MNRQDEINWDQDPNSVIATIVKLLHWIRTMRMNKPVDTNKLEYLVTMHEVKVMFTKPSFWLTLEDLAEPFVEVPIWKT